MNSIWPILIVVLISVVSSALGKINEQREIKKARDAAARRREEAIRTGRDPDGAFGQPQTQQRAQTVSAQTKAGDTSREQRMREIAAKRQAELRDLREKQAQIRAERSATQQPADPSGRMPQQSYRSARVLKPGTPRQRSAPKQTSDADSARQSQLRRERERQREIAQQREIELEAQRRSQDKKRTEERRRKKLDEERRLLSLAAIERRNKAKALAGDDLAGSIREMLTGGTVRSRRDRLRQVIAINEILDKPISERNEGGAY